MIAVLDEHDMRCKYTFVCLFGEDTHARSVVAEASGMAQKIVRRTSFEATRDLARSDNTALLGAAPLPLGHIKARNRWIHCELPPGAANVDLTGCGGQSGRGDPWLVNP